MKKRVMSIILVLVLAFTCVPIGTITASASTDYTEPTIFAESKYAAPGSSVEVNVNVKNNPGIAGATLSISYDSQLTLTNAVSGETFSKLSFTAPGKFTNPSSFLWDSESGQINDDGTMLTLSFAVAEDATPNDNLNVNVSYYTGDIYNENMDSVNLQTVNGCITVIDYKPGDLNGDGTVNGKDITLLRRNIVGSYEININELAGDVNSDGRLNGVDVTLIRRYLVGYDVELKPGKPKCDHTMTSVAYKAATCTENGNIAYWHCSKCDKYFSNAEGTTEITLENTVIPATGHQNIVVDDAVPPTYESTGLTEGSHCEDCGTVIKAQEVVAKPEKNEYSITYYISNNDYYLESINIENNNPSKYTKEDGVNLNNLKIDGYIFEGWYDGEGANGELVKTIPAGTTGNIELYARWTPVTYNINFDNTGLFEVSSETYRVNEDKILPTPKLDGYVFAGWSDADGNIITRIEMGSTFGHKTYDANWISERNKAETFKKIAEPTVYEDDERILFTYYIGKINNVPIKVIKDFGYINQEGVSLTVTETYSETTDDSQMKKLTNTVQKSTTSSYGWTLSDSWSDSVTVDEGWLQETGKNREEVNEISRNESSNWYASSGTSGSSTISSMNSTDSSSSSSSVNNISVRNRNQVKTDDTVSASLKTSVSAEVGAGYGPISAKVGTSIESGTSAVSNVKTDRLSDVKTNDTYSKNNSNATHAEASASNTSSWNSSSGYGGSSSTTRNQSVSESVSEKLSKNYNLSTSYLKSNTSQETQGHENSSSNADEYSSAVTYSKITGTERTETYTTKNTKTGYHRWTLAGTAHVFAQVGYDIASKSYFTTTFTMMDDETHRFEDYSYKTPEYNDFENTVIPFEVPIDIDEYVANRVCESDGIEVTKNGLVTNYNGSDKEVIIPEYKVIDNQDGTNTVVKITAISPTAFAGKDIKTVEISNFVTEIPAHAFENCTSLTHVNALGVTKIGDCAFAGCTSIEELQVCEQITELGENIVSDQTRLYVMATNKGVVESAVKSNAKSIAISILDECTDLENTELIVPSNVEKFLINGFGATFNNVKLKSYAGKTIINRANFNSTGTIPIVISSENVELHEVSIGSSGIGLALTNNITNLSLRGNCYINSNGENSMLCKNITTKQIDSNLNTTLQINGNILTCGGISEDISHINCEGNIIIISSEIFDKYLLGQYNVIFDANGGTVSESKREMFYGETFGELPTPTRDYYTFVGWYTKKEVTDDDTAVTEDTVATTLDDITLYAKWELNKPSEFVLASEVPDGAQIVNQKWSYTLREYKESSSSSLSGYTKYDTKRTSWGVTQGPVYSNPQNGSRNVWSEQYVSGYNTRHIWHFYKYGYSPTDYSYSVPSGGRTKYDVYLTYYPTTTGQRPVDYSGGKFRWWNGNNWAAVYFENEYDENNPDSPIYSTRWYYQEPIYTYYFYRDVDKEETTDPTGQSNVSNVQEWVQYRAK